MAPTLFLPMKTPMSSEILANWSLPDPPAHSHSLPALLVSQSERGRQVGMVLDLANHECLCEWGWRRRGSRGPAPSRGSRTQGPLP